MQHEFHLFPEQASTVAPKVDAIYFYLLCVAAFFTALIFLAIVYLAIKYRRGRPEDRPRPSAEGFWMLEVLWIGIPFLLTMVMFVWGARVFFEMQIPPRDAIELQVIGKQWMWKIQHPQGRSEINELHVPLGQRVRLKMISEDVIHSFYIPAFRVKMDVLPDRYTTLWFEATKPGDYYLFCAEYCGTDHAKMSGHVHVMDPSDYSNWLAGAIVDPPQTTGEKLFTQFRCHACHSDGSDVRSPRLHGLFGSPVAINGGQEVRADETYLRESILNPMAKIAAGYQPVMPTYEGQLSEEQVLQLIEYMKSLPAAGNDDAS